MDNDIGLTVKDIAEEDAQAREIDKRKLPPRLDLDHHVHVAPGPGRSTSERAEKRETHDASSTKLGLMRLEYPHRILTSHVASFTRAISANKPR